MSDLTPLHECTIDDLHEVLRRLPEHFARPRLKLSVEMPTEDAAGYATVLAIDPIFGLPNESWAGSMWDGVPFAKPEEAPAAARQAVFDFLDAVEGTVIRFDRTLRDYYHRAAWDLIEEETTDD